MTFLATDINSDSYVQEQIWNNFFDISGDLYSLNSTPVQTKDYIERLVQSYRPQNVLDNGCGVGRIKTILDNLNVSYIGIDISENALQTAIDLNYNSPYFIKAEAHKLPFLLE